MIAFLLCALLIQDKPQPRPERPPREQEAIDRLRRELESLPPDSPQRDRVRAELRRLEIPQPRPPEPAPPSTSRGPEAAERARREFEAFKRRPGEPPPRLFDASEVGAWLRENEPETYRRVEKANEEGRQAEAMRLLAEADPRMREMAELKTRDPKAFEKAQELRRLERESLEVAERARAASPADREAAAKKLRETLDRLFDLREEQKARELEELKRRVGEIEKQLEARKASKERIVERRRRELLGERLQDDW